MSSMQCSLIICDLLLNALLKEFSFLAESLQEETIKVIGNFQGNTFKVLVLLVWLLQILVFVFVRNYFFYLKMQVINSVEMGEKFWYWQNCHWSALTSFWVISYKEEVAWNLTQTLNGIVKTSLLQLLALKPLLVVKPPVKSILGRDICYSNFLHYTFPMHCF